MILVAGPYRSGTNDDPALIRKNVDAMTGQLIRPLSVRDASFVPAAAPTA